MYLHILLVYNPVLILLYTFLDIIISHTSKEEALVFNFTLYINFCPRAKLAKLSVICITQCWEVYAN